jgi:hypothetical protein
MNTEEDIDFVNGCGDNAQWVYCQIKKHVNSNEPIFYLENNGVQICVNRLNGDVRIVSENFNIETNLNEQKKFDY